MLKKLLPFFTLFFLYSLQTKAQCPLAEAGENDTICLNGTLTLSATLPSGFTGKWTILQDNFKLNFENTESPSATVSGFTEPGKVGLVWTISNGETCNASDTISIDIQNRPIANAGQNQTVCVGGAITLNAIKYPNLTGSWTTVGTSTINIQERQNAQTVVSGFTEAAVTHTLQWIVSNASCGISDTDEVTITVNPLPTAAKAGEDLSVCKNDTLQIIGNTPVVGTPGWVVANGIRSIYFTSRSNVNNDTTFVRGTVGGNYSIIYRISNGNNNVASLCTSSDTLIVRVNFADFTAGTDLGICDPAVNSISLNASPLQEGHVGSWSVLKGAGIITDAGNPKSEVTSITSDTLVLQWRLSAGNCSDSSEVSIYKGSAPSIASAGPDINTCQLDTLILIGSTANSGSPSWEVITGDPEGISFYSPFENLNDTVLTNLNAAGTYQLRYTIALGGIDSKCAHHDTLTIQVSKSPEVATSADIFICDTTQKSFLISGNEVKAGETGKWSFVSGSGTILNPTDSITTVSGLIQGENKLLWTKTHENGCFNSALLTIGWNVPPTEAMAGEDKVVCNGDTVLLIGNTPLAGSPSWLVLNGNIATIYPEGSGNNDSVKVLIHGDGTFKVRYRIANGTNDVNSGCVSMDTISVTAGVCTGVNGREDISVRLYFYPNPAGEKTNLFLNSANLESAELSFYTLAGVLIKKENLGGGTSQVNQEINLSEMTKGIYIVKVQKGDEVNFGKIIVP